MKGNKKVKRSIAGVMTGVCLLGAIPVPVAAETESQTDVESAAEVLTAAASPSAAAEILNSETGTFSVRVQNAAVSSGEKIYAAIWQDSGQKDLKWTVGSEENGTYVIQDSAVSHGYRTGTYHIHIYKRSRSGTMTFLTNTSLKVQPSAESVSAEYNQTTSKVTLTGVKTYGTVSSVKVAVWSSVNGQDDITWETASRQSDGTWTADIPMSSHSDFGKYYVHAYAFTRAGKSCFLGSTTFTAAGVQVNNFEASVDGTSFTLTVDSIASSYNQKNVKIAVWSGSDQSNIAWYTASKSGSSYKVESTTAKHKNSTGTYHAHLYIEDTDGTMYFGSGIRFTIEEQTANEVTISNVDPEAGSFSFAVKTAASDDLSYVTAAVWCPPGQGNIKWYKLSKAADGSWTGSMNISAHQNLYGNYHVHAYAVLKDGSMKFLAANSQVLNEENRVVTETLSEDSVRITIYNAALNGNTGSSVLFPTWSSEDGQDDLVWYEGVKASDGSYSVVVDLDNHEDDGDFITHIYVSDGSSQKLVKALSYTLTGGDEDPEEDPDENTDVIDERAFDSAAKAVMHNIIYAVETGGQVYGGHRYDCFTEAYKNSTAEHAITIGAGAWYANEAKTLLNRIRSQYPAVFAQYDTAGIAEDLDTEDWRTYGTDGEGNKTILTGSDKANAIQAIINTNEGRAVQDALIDEQMEAYVAEAEALGVRDLKAKLFCANIRHLGGYGPMARVINYCKTDGDAIIMENLWSNMREREAGSGNLVGSDKYARRHQKVMEWLNTYL